MGLDILIRVVRSIKLFSLGVGMKFCIAAMCTNEFNHVHQQNLEVRIHKGNVIETIQLVSRHHQEVR